MKKSGLVLIFAVAAVMLSLTSCKLPSTKRLEAENAKLQEDIIKSDSVQIQFMNAYAEIEANLNEIKLREKIINDNSQDAEMNADIQQRIISDIVEIGKLMENNRKKLQEMDKLRKQLVSARSMNKKLKEENAALKDGIAPAAPVRETTVRDPQDQQKIAELGKENARLAELNKTLNETVNNLKTKLAESEARIESLQTELSLLKEAYAALQRVNDSLKAKEADYLAQLNEKDGVISALNAQLASSNAVYYFIGTAKDIKAKNILLKKSVNPNLELKNCIKVEDMSELTVIETKSSKPVLYSLHPSKSYDFDAKDPKNVKIKIKDPKSFWSNSRVCVVEVK